MVNYSRNIKSKVEKHNLYTKFEVLHRFYKEYKIILHLSSRLYKELKSQRLF